MWESWFYFKCSKNLLFLFSIYIIDFRVTDFRKRLLKTSVSITSTKINGKKRKQKIKSEDSSKKTFENKKNLLIWNIIILCFFVKEEELKKKTGFGINLTSLDHLLQWWLKSSLDCIAWFSFLFNLKSSRRKTSVKFVIGDNWEIRKKELDFLLQNSTPNSISVKTFVINFFVKRKKKQFVASQDVDGELRAVALQQPDGPLRVEPRERLHVHRAEPLRQPARERWLQVLARRHPRGRRRVRGVHRQPLGPHRPLTPATSGRLPPGLTCWPTTLTITKCVLLQSVSWI